MNIIKNQIIQFIIMVIIGILFNPMNILAFRFNDLYLSLTLIYGGLLMASNMIWSHEIVHYLSHNKLDSNIFIFGILLSLSITFLLLRTQYNVDDNQWLKRMISHHSTALTTSEKIYKRTKDPKLRQLARQIIDTQELEIYMMKHLDLLQTFYPLVVFIVIEKMVKLISIKAN